MLNSINLSMSEEIHGIALNSAYQHPPSFRFLSRPLRQQTPCQLMRHQQAPALRLHQHLLQGRRTGIQLVDCQGHYAPFIWQSPLPQLPPLTSGFCFSVLLWCVTVGCRFVFNMCDRIHLTSSVRKRRFLPSLSGGTATFKCRCWRKPQVCDSEHHVRP